MNLSGLSSCLQGNSTVGWQMDTTCPAVTNRTSVNCPLQNIRDLTGIEYFDNLDTLICRANLLTWLPPMPSGLVRLECYSNQITTLPTLPENIIYVDCSHNQIASINAFPTGVKRFDCNGNQLTSLPPLPYGIQIINCYGNQLTALPAFPATLRGFTCANNPITSLPALTDSIVYIYCNGTQITSLPELPDSIHQLYCFDNPQLRCMPPLKYVYDFRYYNTGILCLPNYPRGNMLSQPALNTKPICDLYNTNNCPVVWNLGGNTFLDNNQNCINDLSEKRIRNIKVNLAASDSIIEQVFTNDIGQYTFETDSFGAFATSIDTNALPFLITCPADNLLNDTLTVTDTLHYDRNFALECKPGVDLTVWAIECRFRPANTSRVSIYSGTTSSFYGVECAAGVSGTVVVDIQGPVTYLSPAANALTPSNVINNIITYNITDLSDIQFDSSFNMMLHTDTFATIGDTVCFTVSITPSVQDNNPANNILTMCFPVLASYDPNDKQVYPAGDIDTAQEWLTYTVRFQNTGTAEAQHIYITDTLDSNIDVSSFQLLAYSHQPMVQIKENAVRFNYPNINLPDSNTNEPESHGYVQYKVKLKDNLAIGTQINNTAFIYFDFNEPVITNTTTNTISVISGIPKSELARLSFEMFPNPANDVVSVVVDEPLIGAVLTVSDITGRNMAIMNIEHRMSNIEVKDFSSGIYFVAITHNSRNAVKRLAVQK